MNYRATVINRNKLQRLKKVVQIHKKQNFEYKPTTKVRDNWRMHFKNLYKIREDTENKGERRTVDRNGATKK